jgi:CheY-like chemotaxis protein
MATETPATQAKRVLVVEGEPLIRMLFEDMLGELGYTVAAEAARIEEALEATKNANFDLAMLDAISPASPPRRLPMPSLPAARRSSLPRAMARCPSPIATGRC